MIDHDRISHVVIKMRQSKRTSKTNDLRNFFCHSCFFAVLLSMTRFLLEISTYFLFLFDEFFFIIIKSFTRLSSCHKSLMFFCFVHVTFYRLIKNFQIRRDWNFFFDFVCLLHLMFRIRLRSIIFLKSFFDRTFFFRAHVCRNLVLLRLLRWL
jgi:hypothetical protein